MPAGDVSSDASGDVTADITVDVMADIPLDATGDATGDATPDATPDTTGDTVDTTGDTTVDTTGDTTVDATGDTAVDAMGDDTVDATGDTVADIVPDVDVSPPDADTNPPDETPPAWSDEAAVEVVELGATAVIVSWSGASDDVGVVAYVLQLDEADLAEIAGDEYSFKMIGGTLNGKELYIADFPKFSVDDTVILFLNSETSSVLGPTIGLWQGVFFVDTKQPGNAVVTDHLRRPIVGVKDRQLILSAGTSGSGGINALSTTSGSRGLDLDEFFREVESHRSSSGK
jgi:hypothetical protein